MEVSVLSVFEIKNHILDHKYKGMEGELLHFAEFLFPSPLVFLDIPYFIVIIIYNDDDGYNYHHYTTMMKFRASSSVNPDEQDWGILYRNYIYFYI